MKRLTQTFTHFLHAFLNACLLSIALTHGLGQFAHYGPGTASLRWPFRAGPSVHEPTCRLKPKEREGRVFLKRTRLQKFFGIERRQLDLETLKFFADL
jgi:hypothetical protein